MTSRSTTIPARSTKWRCTTARAFACASCTKTTTPPDKANAVRTLMEAQDNEEVLTGVFYINTEKPTFIDLLNVVDEPLSTLPESLTRPPKAALDALMQSLQ